MAFINSRTLFANKERTEQLVTVLKTLEWAVPTPDADTDGACPSCNTGKPMKFQVIPEAFDPKNHMVYCKLAAALKVEDN
jgi:hypothetical protein